jgi:hypothetical protein
MTEGTVPVPPYRPCAYRDDDVLPVQELSHFGGSRSGGGETPLSVQLAIEHFYRAHIFYISGNTRFPRFRYKKLTGLRFFSITEKRRYNSCFLFNIAMDSEKKSPVMEMPLSTAGTISKKRGHG